jgi:hypothetical protein
MATDNIERSYGDTSRVDDVVLNAIEILTARETNIFNMVERSEARDTVHSYLTDTLKSAENNAEQESGSYTYDARTTPSRLTNIVQNVVVPFKVSRTQQRVEHFHGRDELERQTEKALKEWGNDAEFAMVRSTQTSGASGTAPKMDGVINAISKSSNTTSHTSGTTWSASILDGLMKDNWDNSNGDVATDLFMGSELRKVTDGFTQKTNQVVNAPGVRSIVRTVSSYETAFGTLRLHKHRYVQQSSDSTGRVLGIRPEKLAVAFLERPYIDDGLARDGDFDPRAVAGKFTVEVRNQDSNFFSDGFNIG